MVSLALWRKTRSAEPEDAAAVLARGPLRVLRAPEPALLLAPRAPPCAAAGSAAAPAAAPAVCLQHVRDAGLQQLDLGARHALAKLLLETQAQLY
ncbi:unnamed protein product [Parnassius apollo]|uniref:(apollo) hypothetical protein n=1 Tax=Parnassius apollo TaxID=110799 RepID=A0A8S3WBN5_PARAO|nr:unnamed protein product [Parnassius apollo]